MIATSLATEPWRDGKWLELIDCRGLGGYDQSGSCYGQVKIYNNELSSYINDSLSYTELELNLPGMRKRLWGSREKDDLLRLVCLTGTVADGCVFEVGASSGKFGLTQ